MRLVVCKKMKLQDGKVCVIGSNCPYCDKPLAEHKEVADTAEHEVREITLNEVDNHGSVKAA